MTRPLGLTAEDFTEVLRPARDALADTTRDEQISEGHGIGEAADGWVRAIVAPSGRVAAIQLGEPATALPAGELAAAVVTAVNAGRARAVDTAPPAEWDPEPLLERQRDTARAATALIGKLVAVADHVRQD